MRTILLSGGIGSGKSEVARYLTQSRGWPVYDSDSRAKMLYDEAPGLLGSIESALGCRFRMADGKLDRKHLASVIFSDNAARETLESILYPVLLKDFENWRDAQSSETVVLESAVATEKPIFASVADDVMLVMAPEHVRIRRAMERDGASREDVAARIKVQNPYIRNARWLVHNGGTIEQLHIKIDNQLNRIK